MSTKVGLFFAACFPPAFSSGKPGRVRSYRSKLFQPSVNMLFVDRLTLDNRWSVATRHTSLYFVTSHAKLPSYSLIFDTGSVARRPAYSTGGSKPEARRNGNDGG